MGAGVLNIQAARKLVLRVLSVIAGLAIITHEVAIADAAEPFLVIIGMWFLGIPPALILDSLRRVNEAVGSVMGAVEPGGPVEEEQAAVDEPAVETAPDREPTNVTTKPEPKRRRDDGREIQGEVS
jgi:hypothetical protein